MFLYLGEDDTTFLMGIMVFTLIKILFFIIKN